MKMPEPQAHDASTSWAPGSPPTLSQMTKACHDLKVALGQDRAKDMSLSEFAASFGAIVDDAELAAMEVGAIRGSVSGVRRAAAALKYLNGTLRWYHFHHLTASREEIRTKLCGGVEMLDGLLDLLESETPQHT